MDMLPRHAVDEVSSIASLSNAEPFSEEEDSGPKGEYSEGEEYEAWAAAAGLCEVLPAVPMKGSVASLKRNAAQLPRGALPHARPRFVPTGGAGGGAAPAGPGVQGGTAGGAVGRRLATALPARPAPGGLRPPAGAPRGLPRAVRQAPRSPAQDTWGGDAATEPTEEAARREAAGLLIQTAVASHRVDQGTQTDDVSGGAAVGDDAHWAVHGAANAAGNDAVANASAKIDADAADAALTTVALHGLCDTRLIDFTEWPEFFDDMRTDLVSECRKYGDVVCLCVDRDEPLGSAFVRFAAPSHAAACHAAMHRRCFAGRQLTAELHTSKYYWATAKNVEDIFT